jgi:predicted ATPase
MAPRRHQWRHVIGYSIAPLTPILGGVAAIVGRSVELAEIDRALAETQAGHGRLVFVGGPAGIGKSHLADAAIELAECRGMSVARSFAIDDPGAPALWPWLRLLQRRVGTAALPAADAGQVDVAARFQLFVAITDLLLAEPEPGGLLLVLEDFHWADGASVRLLKHIAAELTTTRVAIVVTGRDAVPGPLQDALPDLVRDRVTRAFTLAGLATAEVAAWLPQLIGRSDGSLAAVLERATAGNPLLIRLVAADLAASPVPVDELMAQRPELRRLVAARLSPLTREAREVVAAATVLGERVDPVVLSAMTGLALA